MVHRSGCISVCVFTFSLLLLAAGANAQDWFRTGTGLGVEKPRVAAADFAARADNAKSHSQLFTQVVRDDLQFSGILDLVSPSFYPVQVPSTPPELHNTDWTTPHFKATLVTFSTLSTSIE